MLLCEIDALLCEIWESLPVRSLRHLNCLIYAGATVALEEQGKRRPELDENEVQSENDTNEEPNEMPVEEMQIPEAEMATPDTQQRAKAETKGQKVTWLRKVIGWIEAEIQRQRKQNGKRPTRK